MIKAVPYLSNILNSEINLHLKIFKILHKRASIYINLIINAQYNKKN